ncbi:MAG: hypothetical protein K0R71_23 [Bacillales bacterium]|jgi:uncharacterized protein YlaN (UPF0358 family)|nr:hypothetical protein [Bacillales bacterium]
MFNTITLQLRSEALEQFKKDANHIVQLIQVQINHSKLPQCPFFEEVLDTQIVELLKGINFAVSIGLFEESDGRSIMEILEKELSMSFNNRPNLTN